MKKGIIILLLALATGLCAFTLMRSQKRSEAARPVIPLLEVMPELTWLKEELKLTDLQFAKVSELHAAYRPKCVEMCERIAQSHARMDKTARETTVINPELQEEIAAHARIHAECQRAILDHLYRTAAELDKDQAKRYLDTMLPYALDFSHSEPKGATHAH